MMHQAAQILKPAFVFQFSTVMAVLKSLVSAFNCLYNDMALYGEKNMLLYVMHLTLCICILVHLSSD